MPSTYVRWSARATTLRRPSWHSDIACLKNAIRYLNASGSPIILVADTPIPDSLWALEWGEVVTIPAVSNSQSFLACLDIALSQREQHELIYFVEQDYLHVPEALAVLADGFSLNPDGYVTLFDDPLYYWQSADVTPVSLVTSVSAGIIRHWRTSPSTTMTFAAPAWVLARDRHVFEEALANTEIPPDRSLWAELALTGRTLVSSLPGAASHIETTSLTPFVDWRGLSESERGPVPLPDVAHWADLLTSIKTIAVGPGVPAENRGQVAGFGMDLRQLDLGQLGAIRDPIWVLLTPEEKAVLDAVTRDRSTPVVGVIVCSTPEAYRGRWFSGRDWFLADLMDAHHASADAKSPAP